jgi:hypothetical protein
MIRRPALATLIALLLVSTVAPSYATARQPLAQEADSPINDQGSSYNYRSHVTVVEPPTRGLSVQVLEFADRLQLTNRTGKTVTVYGYSYEPYARLLADGTVQLNTHSPAYYLDKSFYANATVPPYATPHAKPLWTVVDRVGQLEWHDHRIHWMSPVAPPQVKDKSKRTKVFDWQVPIRIGSQNGSINGQLFWVPTAQSSTPLAAILAFGAILLGGIAFVLVVRRRRRAQPPTSGSGVDAKEGQAAREAW